MCTRTYFKIRWRQNTATVLHIETELRRALINMLFQTDHDDYQRGIEPAHSYNMYYADDE